MARIDNLNNFLTDVASAIKEKTGVTSITPANFDSAIKNISGGAKINGAEATYYVGAGETINEGDFVTLQLGVASTSNQATYWDILEPELGVNSMKTIQLNEKTFVCMYLSARGEVCLLVGDVYQDRHVKRFTQVAATPAHSMGDIARTSETEFFISWDACGRYCKLEGDVLFLGPITSLGDPLIGSGSTMPSAYLASSVDSRLGLVFLEQRNTYRQMSYLDGLSAPADRDYELYPISGAVVMARSNVYSKSPVGSPSYTDALQGCVLSNCEVILAYFSSSTIIDDDGTKAGTTGLYGRIFSEANNLWGPWTLLVSTDVTTARLLCPKTESDYFYIMVAGSDESVVATRVTASGETLSVGSATKILPIQPDEISMIYCCPINETQAVIYFPLYGYKYNGSTFSNPYGFSVATMSKSSISAGTVFINSDIPESLARKKGNVVHEKTGKLNFLTTNSSNDNIYSKSLSYSGAVITDVATVSTLEEQVIKSLPNSKCNGIAKTNGTGGTAMAHKDSITVYIPN